MADNPIMEPDLFYGTTKAEESDDGQPEAEAVTSEEAVADESLNTPEQEDEAQAEESEESEGEDDASDAEDDDETLFVELDGEEVDLETIKKWRDGHFMQEDYTRKTQKLAEERKETQAALSEANKLKAQLSEGLAELQALVEESEAVDLNELREYDPSEYIKQKEKLDKRKAAVEKYKAASAQPALDPAELEVERQKLFEANPSWIDDKGQPTKQMTEDTKALEAYWKKHGFTPDEISGMTRARYIETSLKAAKYDALQEKSKSTLKKTKKAAVVSKSKPQAKKAHKPKAIEDVFYGSGS